MESDWKSIIEDRINELTSYRSDNNWYISQRSSSDSSVLDSSILSTNQESWQSVQLPTELADRAEYWIRLDYIVPVDILGISVSGSKISLQSRTLKPMEISVDGKAIFYAPYWSDLCAPETIITERAEPGRTLQLLIRVDSPGSTGINDRFEVTIDIEVVEDFIFELETFLQEIAFCDCITQCIAPKMRSLYEDAIHMCEDRIGVDHAANQLVPGDFTATTARIRGTLAPLADYCKSFTVHLIGHAHIDMNWLWPMEDTIDVCKRDFSTMLQFIEEFPSFHFSQSQAAVYDITEKHLPELFSRIRHHIDTKRWDVTAATWTEGDLNMANGEATIRQILMARRYCESKFEASARVCWEPDTFGHPATIPQILKKCGISYYYHSRCGRGDPLYIWEGPDGSEILVFNSVYNNRVNSADIVKVSRTLLEQHGLRDALFVYGVGNHGGGATRRDIERALLLDNLPTMPRVAFSSAHRFYDAVAQRDLSTLPRVTGELNPVFNGCYTTHANLKHLMRSSENRLLEFEAAAIIAEICIPQDGVRSVRSEGLDNSGPGEQAHSTLEDLWRQVLFNQFHDIYCGCAVHTTYEVAEPELREVVDQCTSLIRGHLSRAWASIASLGIPRSEGTTSIGRNFAVWNLQGYGRTEIVAVEKPEGWQSVSVIDDRGEKVPVQIFEANIFFVATDVPSFGFREYTVIPVNDAGSEVPRIDIDRVSSKSPAGNTVSLQSDFYSMTIDMDSGCITHLEEKENGRIYVDAKSPVEHMPNYNNLFTVEYEMPHRASAWNIGEISRTENLTRGAEVVVASSGAVMDVVSVKHRVGKSTIDQRIFFYRELRRIDFKTVVHWDEVSGPDRDAPLLQVSFKPELSEISRTRYDIPFGMIERNSDGTEYPGQKWVDVSDAQGGMSLLNDGRYGFRCTGDTISMTCIRTSYAPDPEPDRGEHTFGYALFPHSGDPVKAGIPREAAGFNSPLIPVSAELMHSKDAVRHPHVAPVSAAERTADPSSSVQREYGFSLLRVEGEGIVVSSLKGDAQGAGVILRVYEAAGGETIVSVDTALTLAKVEEIAPTEDRVIKELSLDGDATWFSDRIGSYEIKTYRIIGALL